MKQNDWILANLNNPTFVNEDFKSVGLNSENTGLLSYEEYKNSETIQKAFTNKEGNFDENAFKNYYNTKANAFQDFSSEDFVNNAINDIEWDPYGDFRPVGDVKTKPINLTYQMDFNPNRVKKGVEGVNYISKPTLSVSELAQTQNIFDYNKDTFLKETPNDRALFKNPFKFVGTLFNPIVMASWEEDGTHINPVNGQEVSHKKGEYKLNEVGTYYTETLDGRDLYNKELITGSDLITVDGTGLNKIDFFDSDGLKKSVAGTLTKTLVRVLPLFTPLAGIYTKYIIATEIAQTLPMLYNMTIGLFDSDYESNARKITNTIGAIGSNFRTDNAKYTGKGNFSFDSIMNMVGDIALQWASQQYIAKTVNKLYNNEKLQKEAMEAAAAKYTELTKKLVAGQNSEMEKMIKMYDLTNKGIIKGLESAVTKIELDKVLPIIRANQNMAGSIALGYMALTSNTDVYDSMLRSGVTKNEAAITSWMSTIGMFGVDKWLHLDELFLRNNYDDIKGAVTNILKENTKQVKKELTELASKKTLTIADKVKEIAKIGFSSGKNAGKEFFHKIKYGGLNVFEKGLGEGLEETTEELSTDIAKSIFELSSKLGFTHTKEVDTDAFDNVAARYAMSFFGGFLGGTLYGGIDIYNNGIDQRTSSKDILNLIEEGKTNDLLSELEIWHNKGKLGDKNLSATKFENGTTKKGETKRYWLSGDTQDNQNEAVYNILKSTILSLDRVVKKENLNITGDELVDKYINNYIKIDNIKKVESKYKTFIVDDFKDISKQLIDKTTELENITLGIDNGVMVPDVKLKEYLATNQDKISKLTNEINDIKLKRDKILSGEESLAYIDKYLFAINESLNAPLVNTTYKQFVRSNYDKDINLLSDKENEQYLSEYKTYITSGNQKNDLATSYNIFKSLNKNFEKYVGDFESYKKVKIWRTKLDNTFFNEDSKLKENVTLEELNNFINDEIADIGFIDRFSKSTLSDIYNFLLDKNNTIQSLFPDIKMTVSHNTKDTADFLTDFFINLEKEPISDAVEQAYWTFSDKILPESFYTELDLTDYIPDIKNDYNTLIAILNKNNKLKNRTFFNSLSEETLKDIRINLDKVLNDTSKITLFHLMASREDNKYNINELLNNAKSTKVVDWLVSLSDDENILSLLEYWDKQYWEVGKDNFIISDNNTEQLESLLKLIDIAKIPIIAATDNNDLYGYNNIHNTFKKDNPQISKDYEELPVLNNTSAGYMLYELNLLSNTINTLLQTSLTNIANKYKEQDKTEIALINAKLNILKNIFDKSEYKLLDNFTVDKDDLADSLIKSENNFYTNFKKLVNSGISEQDIIDSLISDSIANDIVIDSSLKELTGQTVGNYLLSIMTIPSSNWVSIYNDIIKANDKIAPFASQEFATRIAVSWLLNPSLFRSVLNKINSQYKLYNSIYITGVGGSGKTDVIIKNIIDIYNKLKKTELAIAGPTKFQVDKLETVFKNKYKEKYTITELLEKILGNEYSNYIKAKEKSNKEPIDNDYILHNKLSKGYLQYLKPGIIKDGNRNLPEIIVIDEATNIDRLDLLLLEQYCEKFGTKIIYSGDNYQLGKPINIKNTHLITTPKLFISLRDNNAQKKFNNDILISKVKKLEKLYKEYEQYLIKEVNPSSEWLQNNKEENERGLQFKYYNEDEFFGDFVIDKLENLDIFSKNEKIVYIYDDEHSSTYLFLKKLNDSRIEFKKLADAQGYEWDHTIIDLHKDDSNPGKIFEHYKELYTACTRSSKGNLIIKNNLNISSIKENRTNITFNFKNTVSTYRTKKLEEYEALIKNNPPVELSFNTDEKVINKSNTAVDERKLENVLDVLENINARVYTNFDRTGWIEKDDNIELVKEGNISYDMNIFKDKDKVYLLNQLKYLISSNKTSKFSEFLELQLNDDESLKNVEWDKGIFKLHISKFNEDLDKGLHYIEKNNEKYKIVLEYHIPGNLAVTIGQLPDIETWEKNAKTDKQITQLSNYKNWFNSIDFSKETFYRVNKDAINFSDNAYLINVKPLTYEEYVSKYGNSAIDKEHFEKYNKKESKITLEELKDLTKDKLIISKPYIYTGDKSGVPSKGKTTDVNGNSIYNDWNRGSAVVFVSADLSLKANSLMDLYEANDPRVRKIILDSVGISITDMFNDYTRVILSEVNTDTLDLISTYDESYLATKLLVASQQYRVNLALFLNNIEEFKKQSKEKPELLAAVFENSLIGSTADSISAEDFNRVVKAFNEFINKNNYKFRNTFRISNFEQTIKFWKEDLSDVENKTHSSHIAEIFDIGGKSNKLFIIPEIARSQLKILDEIFLQISKIFSFENNQEFNLSNIDWLTLQLKQDDGTLISLFDILKNKGKDEFLKSITNTVLVNHGETSYLSQVSQVLINSQSSTDVVITDSKGNEIKGGNSNIYSKIMKLFTGYYAISSSNSTKTAAGIENAEDMFKIGNILLRNDIETERIDVANTIINAEWTTKFNVGRMIKEMFNNIMIGNPTGAIPFNTDGTPKKLNPISLPYAPFKYGIYYHPWIGKKLNKEELPTYMPVEKMTKNEDKLLSTNVIPLTPIINLSFESNFITNDVETKDNSLEKWIGANKELIDKINDTKGLISIINDVTITKDDTLDTVLKKYSNKDFITDEGIVYLSNGNLIFESFDKLYNETIVDKDGELSHKDIPIIKIGSDNKVIVQFKSLDTYEFDIKNNRLKFNNYSKPGIENKTKITTLEKFKVEDDTVETIQKILSEYGIDSYIANTVINIISSGNINLDKNLENLEDLETYITYIQSDNSIELELKDRLKEISEILNSKCNKNE